MDPGIIHSVLQVLERTGHDGTVEYADETYRFSVTNGQVNWHTEPPDHVKAQTREYLREIDEL